MVIVFCSGLAACKKNLIAIPIADNDLKKSIPDVAYNSEDNNFFVFWAAAPGQESQTTEYLISGQKISSFGKPLGEPVEVLKTTLTAAMPRVLYNPNKNQYLVIYAVMEGYMNIHGVILDKNGAKTGEPFKVTDVAANQFHYTMAFNSTKNQFFITYNDSRNGAGNIFGVIFDDTGKVVKPEFVINNSVGHQVNPVVCYNPKDDTYLINWEDFRQYGDNFPVMETLNVMTNIMGALLKSDGTILVNNIAMCVDDDGEDADQRFNGIAYNSDKNEFLVTWTDTDTSSLQNIGIRGRIVKADGSMPGERFTVVDAAGAQMIGHSMYAPKQKKYFIAFERDDNGTDEFYFKDINAKTDIGAMWLDDSGKPEGDMLDIFTGDGNQRFVRFAQNTKSSSFLMAWQDDFPGVSDTVNGHIMSAGGNIAGALYRK